MTEAEARAAGFELADYEEAEDPIGVWPENVESVNLFITLGTQWRIGMSSRSGLDYTAVLSVIDRACKSRKRREELFADVLVMEASALKEMAKK